MVLVNAGVHIRSLNTNGFLSCRRHELQNDQQLDTLHSKIRTLRGVYIYDDVERQNSTLDETVSDSDAIQYSHWKTFTTFAGSLAQSSQRAAHAFGSTGSLKQYCLLVLIVGAVVGLRILWYFIGWVWPSSGANV
ncbi:hypothetical protein JB92DRAFT_2700551 [Gautieria morchelliformis]|nr:hypothetical protein JB92DRAFT_2700551 [Gautieria morchelliformis]